jgi:uncharacterized membrane protein (DUF106 family)
MSITILPGIYILTIFILIAFNKIKLDIFNNDRLNLLKSFHLSADDDYKLWLLDYQKENLNTYHNVHLFFVIFAITPLFLAFDNFMFFVLTATVSYIVEISIAYKVLANLKELKKLKYSMENELKKEFEKSNSSKEPEIEEQIVEEEKDLASQLGDNAFGYRATSLLNDLKDFENKAKEVGKKKLYKKINQKREDFENNLKEYLSKDKSKEIMNDLEFRIESFNNVLKELKES